MLDPPALQQQILDMFQTMLRDNRQAQEMTNTGDYVPGVPQWGAGQLPGTVFQAAYDHAPGSLVHSGGAL